MPDDTDLAAWIGRRDTQRDTLASTPVRALAATLDHADRPVGAGTALPPLWHWLYFLPLHRASEIGPDGHARRGAFLPPVALPRRMWAGGRFEFHAPLRVGDTVTRTSTIEDVVSKTGRSGPLVFVRVCHRFSVDGAAAPALVEWHDIVYRPPPEPGAAAPPAQPAPADAAWWRDRVPDDVLLFRYSALTFNAHRIHYDRRYVTQVEGYPGLVVHGPLIATLLLDGLRHEMPHAVLSQFRFQAVRPAFDGQPLRLCGRPDGHTVRLWAQDGDGALVMDAVATLGG